MENPSVPSISDAFTPTKEGGRLAIRLTPRASRTGVDGVKLDTEGRAYLQIRLNVPPVDGAANKALIRFLRKSLKMKKADIEIVSGAKSRIKLLALKGDSEVLKVELSDWISS